MQYIQTQYLNKLMLRKLDCVLSKNRDLRIIGSCNYALGEQRFWCVTYVSTSMQKSFLVKDEIIIETSQPKFPTL
jgi:hypothetical protein